MQNKLSERYIEKIYSGWLAKIIGIRLGAPIEGWTYEKIHNVYGELNHYIVDYKDFAADDDSNGPLFFLRALEDGKGGFDLTAQAVGEALLNYAPFEHGFFWWGGYGISTEHTAYLNLRNGIQAPKSGSLKQNGSAVAEQIGGQIFIDTWGLVAPANTDLAAKYAEKAASVSHGGNGVYGGIFVAVCISHAFEENDIRKIIEKGLSYIPADCEYARVVRAVIAFYEANPDNWRDCYKYIYENFGYDRYPGNCHIIPNTAVMILSLLYGKGNFSDTINICNMCGWDTDCNVGNVATIMGVCCGLDAIDYDKWRKPVNDFLVCSSVVGSLNIMDVPYGASYISKLAWAIAGEKLPEMWSNIFESRIDSCHFEYAGSTHAMRVRSQSSSAIEYALTNTDETSFSGKRSLKVFAKLLRAGECVYLYKKTHYKPSDFHDSRYDPSFSPLLYPGQTVHGSVFLPDYANDCTARLYVRNATTGEILSSGSIALQKGVWHKMSFKIPFIDAGEIDEAGFAFDLPCGNQLCCLIDDLYFDGNPHYSIDFAKAREDYWTPNHREIAQFTRLKGLLYLEDERLHLSCCDFAEAYTGHHKWENYKAEFTLSPLSGERHFVNVRVQGAIRSYAVGFAENNKLVLLKNENGYRAIAQADYEWTHETEYILSVSVRGNKISAAVNGIEMLCVTDEMSPYLTGGIGVSVQNGSHCSYKGIKVSPC